jgi:hypothetical protein
MKYFTSQLLLESSSNDVSISERAEKKWLRNMKAYWKYIKKILPKLPSKARGFFGKIDLHDGVIVSISIGDLNKLLKSGTSSRTSYIEIKVLHPKSEDLFTLIYSCIRDFKMEFHSDRHYREKANYIFGDWLYDELFLERDKWLRHEILLDSNASIAIEFKYFLYKVEKIKKKSNGCLDMDGNFLSVRKFIVGDN